ncbi:integrase core domain-containing protein [Ditylenchus destructor]|uniref:Integrase core domain-containing protein n=1 Tax=Ditylenchus destructor TaxID=166010 RepID=A0AAD4N3D9_9BILA|nr:integrase core domain-containing protein [Ditylenchus destructor]
MEEDFDPVMQAKFNEKLSDFVAQKRFICLPNEATYDSILAALIKFKNGSKLERYEWNYVRRYSMTIINGEEKLFRGNQEIVKREQAFGILHRLHDRRGHAGRDIMFKEVTGYFGLTREIVQIYLSLCQHCEFKKAKVKKGLVVKPILSHDFNSRCQVDLIDLQARPDGDSKFIMVYQDHLTKFVVLDALATKTAAEVARNLIKIFATFGVPKILHSDNGREFANKVVSEVVRQWPICRIVHGKPRHSQSQGSVERANRDIGDILIMNLRQNKSTAWAAALPQVQAAKNSRFHRGIGRSPYEAIFGHKMKLGYEDEPVIEEVDEGGEDPEGTEFITLDGSKWIELAENDEPLETSNSPSPARSRSQSPARSSPSSQARDSITRLQQMGQGPWKDISFEEEEYGIVLDEQDELNRLHFQREQEREGARKQQKRLAEKMLQESAKRNAPISDGQTVRIPIPKEEEDGFYRIGTDHGILSQQYSRNQIEPSSSQFVSEENVPDKEISLRAAVGAYSLSGGQGYKHCSCLQGCKTGKCNCRSLGRRCNSRCHNSTCCKNK